jgi:hypothetical protein
MLAVLKATAAMQDSLPPSYPPQRKLPEDTDFPGG